MGLKVLLHHALPHFIASWDLLLFAKLFLTQVGSIYDTISDSYSY